MKRKLASLGTAGIFAAVFLILVIFSNGCAFNFIPYMLHNAVSGTGAGENTFVEGFDVLFASLIFWLIYRFMRWLTGNKDKGVM